MQKIYVGQQNNGKICNALYQYRKNKKKTEINKCANKDMLYR